MSKKVIALEALGVAMTGDSRVDAESGIIRSVKVLGRESKNKRRYPPDVVARCYKIYEASQVYANHDFDQLRHGKARPMNDWGGVIRDVQTRGGEVFGDLHCLKETSAGRIILEAAQRCPDRFGLSPMHLIESVKGDDGVETVTNVLECWSVDAVTRPATTRTLFEEESMPDPMNGGGGAIAAPPVMGLEDAFAAFLAGALQSPDLDEDQRVALHKDLVKMKKKYLGGEEPEPEEVPPAEEPMPEPAPESHQRPALPRLSKMNERIEQANDQIRRQGVRLLAMEAQVRVDEGLMKALLALPDDDAVARHLDAVKKGAPRPRGASPGAPRSAGRAAVAESENKRGGKAPQLPEGADRETLKKFWRGESQ